MNPSSGEAVVKLILIRFAQAVAPGTENATNDFDRALTAQDKATAAKLVQVLKEQGVELDAVLSSPLVRAVQTAEPLLKLATSPQILICEDLASGLGKPKKVAARLNEMGLRTVALVGHSPDMEELIAWLIGAEESGIRLAKGAATKVNSNGIVSKGGGTLTWQITPAFYDPQEFEKASETELLGQ